MEIRTRDDFGDARRAECLIVITDSGDPSRVHLPHCPHLTAEHFTEKVIENLGRNGRYYVVGSVARAESLHRAIPCGTCHPARPVGGSG